MTLLRGALLAGYLASCRPAHRRFRRAVQDPERYQSRHLLDLVRRNRATAFGKKHGFSSIRTVRQYQQAVPVQDYTHIAPWIERAFRGEKNVLAASPIRIFERTSGSTTANKVVPFTEDYLHEVGQATAIWLYDTYRRHPEMLGGKSYYSISPAMRRAETSPGGVRIGMEDDREYLGFFGRHLVGSLMAVPPGVAHLDDPVTWRRETLFHLLECTDLRFVSIWSPTFLQALLAHLKGDDPVLEVRLSRGARRRLDRARSAGLELRELWPRLAVVSLWKDGPSADFARRLAECAHGVALEPKALIATEGVVSQPFGDPAGAPLAVTTHFLELMHLPSGEIRGAHALVVGERYSPILTTGAGLYRYHLKDIVECVGFVGRVPRVRFVGKLELVSDLCGEKVSSEQALAAVSAAGRDVALTWKQLLPRAVPHPHYAVLVDDDLPELARVQIASDVDESLRSNMHYDYARKIGQLRPIEVVRVKGAGDLYTQWCLARGMRLGDIKFQPLVIDPDFSAFLAAKGGVASWLPS